MSGSVVRQLIIKDLYLYRWMVAGSIAAGLVSVALMTMGRTAAYVGGISLICTLVILNIFLVMLGVAQERKEKALLFILSLPVSPAQYTAAKMVANATAFVVPWLVLTAANVTVIRVSDLPDGVIPFWLAVLSFLLFYYFALLAASFISISNGWLTTVIVAGNVSVNFVIPFLLARPSVRAHADGAAAVWTGDMVSIIAIGIVAGIALLAIAAHHHSRRPDFV